MNIIKASFWRNAAGGLLVAVGLAIAAANLGARIPWLGGAGFGILAGVVIASLARLPDGLRPGFSAAGRQVLQLAIILLGAGLNLAAVWVTGVKTLGLMLITIGGVFAAARILGRMLAISPNNRDLIASGTAICGGSAIAAVAPVIGAKEEEVAYSISVVFLFNLAAVVVFPLLGRAMGMDAEAFGVWAGTAVNDTSSVMAAAFAFEPASAPTAALVKMTRTVMIVPMTLIFSFVAASRRGRGGASGAGGGGFSFVRAFPWFVLGFLAMSLWTTWGGLPEALAAGFRDAGRFLIVVALSGIGLNTNLKKILAAGSRPIFLGGCLWFTVAVLALFAMKAGGLM